MVLGKADVLFSWTKARILESSAREEAVVCKLRQTRWEIRENLS